MSKVGKWIAAWTAAVAAAAIIAVLIWWLIHPGGVLNREPQRKDENDPNRTCEGHSKRRSFSTVR